MQTRPLRRTLLLAALLVSACAAPGDELATPNGPVHETRGAAATPWVMGYYTGWNAELYPPEKVDMTALTHVVVGRALPRADGSLDAKFDNDHGKEIARTLTGRARAAGRSSIMMVGGMGERDGWVGAASDANRARFVRELLATMDELGFDGIDLDWEPIEDSDKPDLLALVQELRAARPDIVLTLPVYWVNVNSEAGDPWYAEIVPYLDQVNVMSYEMGQNWPGWSSWHTSPLSGEGPDRPASIASTLEAWAAAGIPKAKLGMGIPFYGVAWRNISGPYQQYTGWSDYAASDNQITYKYIAKHLPSGNEVWDDAAQASYVTFSTPVDGDVRWISYDSPRAIAAKGAWLRENGYGGAIIWTINQGCTDPLTGANPLLAAVKQAFLE